MTLTWGNTIDDPAYERRALLKRLDWHTEAVCTRADSIKAAFTLQSEGRCTCRWEDERTLIVTKPRRTPQFEPGPRPAARDPTPYPHPPGLADARLESHGPIPANSISPDHSFSV